jgi:catechol 2,3-dioxygenase-like lactoylglutathione lyase family enzyme
VAAFKFRDPDGHPLELLEFPDSKMPQHWKCRSKKDLFLGIDHSGISVSNSERSIAFYEALGLRVAARSLNTGSAQDRLDSVRDAQVEVTALELAQATPHVELLCYRSVPRSQSIVFRSNDVAATSLVFEAGRFSSKDVTKSQALIDPDGHHLVLVASIDSSEPTQATANSILPQLPAKPESAR